MDIKELMQIDTKELSQSVTITQTLREQINSFLVVNKITKEELLEICGMSLTQYYRRRNNPLLYTDENLQQILNYCLNKK